MFKNKLDCQWDLKFSKEQHIQISYKNDTMEGSTKEVNGAYCQQNNAYNQDCV